MKLVKCARCDGTGKFIPTTSSPDPDELTLTRQYLQAEEKFHTGVEPVWNDTVIPAPDRCTVCGGTKTTPAGGVL